MQSLLHILNSDPLYLAALVLFWLVVWIYAIYIYIKGREIEKSYYNTTIIAQYDPPAQISPIVAYYLLSYGNRGKTVGDLSTTGEQIMVLIYLYERGLLSSLQFKDGNHTKVEYIVNPNYATLATLEEERVFLDNLIKAAGHQAVLEEEVKKMVKKYKEKPDGFEKINNFWTNYWYVDLFAITKKLNILHNSKATYQLFLQIFASTITFGAFFSVIVFWISKNFEPLMYLGFLLISPQVIFYLLCLLAVKMLAALNAGFIISALSIVDPELMLIIIGFSWFAWFLIFGKSVKKIYFRFNESGKALLQHMAGYKEFLKTVDTDRVSLTRKDNDSKINSTTFPWLLAYELAGLKQWELWHEVNSINIKEQT